MNYNSSELTGFGTGIGFAVIAAIIGIFVLMS
jgi:hypothetical protein